MDIIVYQSTDNSISLIKQLDNVDEISEKFSVTEKMTEDSMKGLDPIIPIVPTEDELIPPFDRNIHLKTTSFENAEKVTQQVLELRELLKEVECAKNHELWASDDQLIRFLIARNFDIHAAFKLMKNALQWRELRQPYRTLMSPENDNKMENESKTGKIYCSGYDQWKRPVIIFDNTVQNTNSVDDQMSFLGWNLELAVQMMSSSIDKYLVFIHLNNFSLFNSPPLKSTTETINMLCNCYPERLGHCIIYLSPSIFKMFFDSVKSFIDPKTVGKLIFIVGDVSEGSPNDKLLHSIIGPNWKILTGAGQPIYNKNCSPGYNHVLFWPKIMEICRNIRETK
eukprot:gene12344-16555_t